MKNSLYGVIIKVENIDICRSFYRDILNLGAPVMDSAFWVEFRLPGDFSLFLEKKEDNEKISEKAGRISWVCMVKDIDTIIGRLKEYGYQSLAVEEQRIGFNTYVFCDPEGNPFYLCAEKKNSE